MKGGRGGLEYCNGGLKRGLDVLAAGSAAVVLAPLLGLTALLVFLTSGRPVLYTQERVGRGGRGFRLLKFRTMRPRADAELLITARGDSRVTRFGRFLRATKLDETPQILNILRGEMSVVGPRPEVPRYVALYDDVQREVLAVRPGLTDPATVLFRDEEALLATVEASRREVFYVEAILPRKLELNRRYLSDASLGHDLALILRTLLAIAVPRPL